MKANNLVLALCVGFLFSCNSKQEFKSAEKSNEKDSLVPLQRTVIADLPDSLQPKTIFLEDMPKPEVRVVPKGGGETIMLPVLEDDKGEPILDQDGNTILMGDGGLSDFTTFTTDDGLAYDAILCSIVDKNGNLWFGTSGRGVSRYDGKSFRNFTTAHGLADNAVYSILEDKEGNLWFGSYSGGVTRYDGVSFTVLNVISNFGAVDITEDKEGNIWIATFGGGVVCYDGNSFTTFTTDDGLANNTIWRIIEDKSGNLWFGTIGGGVSRYDGKSFTKFSENQGLSINNVSSILEDNAGNLWIGGFGGGVRRYDGQSFTTFSTEHGLVNNVVRSIIQDKEGNFWFGTDGGVSRYDGNFFSNFTTSQGLAYSSVWSITEDNNGNIWFGTSNGGVSRFNGNAFKKFSKIHGLPNSSIRSITEDKTGNLWLGTDGGGVSRYDGKSFTTFSRAQGFSDYSISSTLEDKAGKFWFGMPYNGVFHFDGKSFTQFTTAQGLASNNVECILEDNDGTIWFGTSDNGVSKFDGSSITNYTSDHGLGNNIVNTIFQDTFGKIWFGTNGSGVSQFDGKTFINFTTDHGLANNIVLNIMEDESNNFWFGTREGLSFLAFENQKNLFQKNAFSSDSASSNNLTGKLVQDPKEAQEGISINNKIYPALFKNFGTSEGLPDNFITQIIQLGNGKMAVGTDLGIAVFNISDDNFKIQDLEIFNTFTGYRVKDVNAGQNAMLLDSKGIIWAATGSESTGLVRFDYESLNRNTEPPVVVIQSLKVKDENISWHTLKASLDSVESRKSNLKDEKVNSQDSITTPAYITEEVGLFGRELGLAERDSMKQRFEKIKFDGVRPFYPLPENLVLPYNLNQVSFEFIAIETSRPQMVKYQYLLEGYDEDWRPVTNRSNATFGNIHEGTYTFKLKAQGANGIWTEPVTYTFRVLPPWYRTWWAYGFYFLFLAGLVWRIHLIQKEKTIRIEREKNKDRELAQAKEIEKAYGELGKAHKDLEVSHQNLKSTQAQLIQSEKMASLGELTAGIAHEIQNPLNFVNNFSEVSAELVEEIEEERAKSQEARDETLVSEILGDIKENLEKINHHGRRADAIVKGMLEHSRTGSGEKELTNLNTLAKEYLNLAYQGFKAKNKDIEIDLITEFDSFLPKIEIVRSDIGKVLLNVLNNAFYACAERSRSTGTSSFDIHHSSRHGGQAFEIQKKPQVKVTTKSLLDKIEISIQDNGPGIPEAIKDKIFQPFFTTKPTGQGTGLGLSLSYDIVKAHGGELSVRTPLEKVETKEGEGSVFIILLAI